MREGEPDAQVRLVRTPIDQGQTGPDALLSLPSERQGIEAAIAQLDQAQRNGDGFDPGEAIAIIDSLPDLSKALTEADPKLRRAVFEAFRLRVEIDRNSGLIRLKALVSSAFSQARDLSELGSTKAITGAGFEPATFGL
ncbi:MAG TPA: hypothetical protein VFT19_13570 [Solirubrobacterales bacterium]|nr:hypothetical protein [Solirubrobacterales bacterium]